MKAYANNPGLQFCLEGDDAKNLETSPLVAALQDVDTEEDLGKKAILAYDPNQPQRSNRTWKPEDAEPEDVQEITLTINTSFYLDLLERKRLTRDGITIILP